MDDMLSDAVFRDKVVFIGDTLGPFYLRDPKLQHEVLDESVDAARQPFFEGLAHLTKASLEGLQEELSVKVEYPRFYR